MDRNNKITPQPVDNETGAPQITPSSTLRRCIRRKSTWIIFSILFILIITCSTTILLTKKENPQETSSSTIETTAKSLTTAGTQDLDMMMNSTGITVTLTTSTTSCNVQKCRVEMASYHSKRLAFRTTTLLGCLECPYIYYEKKQYSYSAEWLNMWFLEDFFIKNYIGQDCEKNLKLTDLNFGKIECILDSTCVGFSRKKSVSDTTDDHCWLKTNITVNQNLQDPTWHTVVFNPMF